MKKILLALNSLGIGGIETSCLTQTKEFSRRGYEIYILGEEGIMQSEFENIKNVHIISTKYEPKKGMQKDKIQEARKILKENKIDIVYIHKYEALLSLYPACILEKIPYIAYVHFGVLNLWQDYINEWLQLSNEYAKFFFKNAYKVVCISEESKNENKESFGLPEEKYEVVPNAMDFGEDTEEDTAGAEKGRAGKTEDKEDKENKNGNANNINKLLVVSRMNSDKGHAVDNAISLFKALKKYNPNIQMNIIGDGANKDRYAKEIEEQSLNIKLLGPKNNVMEYIPKYDIILGVDRVIQEAILTRKIPIILGYEDFKGMVTPKNIEKVSSVNFSGSNLQTMDFDVEAKYIVNLSTEKIKRIENQNYEWLYRNRNIKNNIYDVKDLAKAKKEAQKINVKEFETLMFYEIGKEERKYNKNLKQAWDIKDKTEDYYLKKEEWDNNQIKNKDEEIEKLENELKIKKTGKFSNIIKRKINKFFKK